LRAPSIREPAAVSDRFGGGYGLIRPRAIDASAARAQISAMSSAQSPVRANLVRRANAFWDWLAQRFSMPGVLVGAIFFSLSLTPSLLPRTETVQAILSGC